MAPFCYWEVYKSIDFYLLLAVGCIATLILVYIIRQSIQIVKFFRKIAKKVALIYFFCLLWAILYVGKIIYLLLEYGLVMQYEEQEIDMFKPSQYFCLIDTLPTFFLMYLLILVPYFWLKNITSFLERMKRDQRKDKMILKLFTFYIFMRIFIYLGLLIAELCFTDQETVSVLCDSVVMIILFEVSLSFSLLCYGMLKLFRNFASLNVNEKKDKKRVINKKIIKFRNEYLIMIGCSFVRFAMDFYFIIWDKTSDQGSNCFQHRQKDFIYTVLYIALGEVFMHLAPIITILTIYQIDFKVFDSLKVDQRD